MTDPALELSALSKDELISYAKFLEGQTRVLTRMHGTISEDKQKIVDLGNELFQTVLTNLDGPTFKIERAARTWFDHLKQKLGPKSL